MNARTPTPTDAEARLRVELAACYRLAAMFGMTDLISTHISARIPGELDQFLLNPYGLLFEEITASSLVRVDGAGNKLSDSPHPVNPAGFVIHSAVHAARHDVVCVMHVHTRAGVAVSALEDGLLPISQQATVVMQSLGYHDYEGVAVRDEEKARLQANLGDKRSLILRNHGLLTVGRSVGEAFKAMYTLESACRIQLDAQAAGRVRLIDPAINTEALQSFQSKLGSTADLAWLALLRKLDRTEPDYRS